MDRRTQDSKLVGKALADALREDLVRAADATALEYRRADRCRICGRDSRGLPNAIDVLTIVDRELVNNSTYRGAVEAVEALVAEWPPDQQPNYDSVRNHAKQHLKRDDALVRRLMEAYALEEGIDVVNGEGSILNPRGVLALILEKGYEEVKEGRVTPTISDTIAAGRAMSAIERERLLAQLEESNRTNRLLMTLLREGAPDSSVSITRAKSELSEGRGNEEAVPALSETDASDHPVTEEGSGFRCEECETVAKSRGGLLQHKRRKHANASSP